MKIRLSIRYGRGYKRLGINLKENIGNSKTYGNSKPIHPSQNQVLGRKKHKLNLNKKSYEATSHYQCQLKK